ncbi:MAG: CaiB/BaiF CoA-transferase family protein [Pseudomonadota bacterium]
MLPLEGLVVIAIEQAVAAPYASSRLADAGAQVIKIERPEGDFARGYDDVAQGQSSYFVWLNRGKETRTLDLTLAEDKETLKELISSADVMIQNLKPGALARLGIDPAQLRKQDPRLISCSISGFGEEGPLADRKAYDLLIQAESGLCSITGGPSEPARVGISIVDIATGACAYEAILEALIRRGVTGKGAEISVSMFDVIADWLTVPLLNHEGGESPKRIGLAHPSIAPYGVYEPKSGRPILISIQSDREWAILCSEFIGDRSLIDDPCYATNVARVANRADTDAIVGKAFSRFDAQEAEKLLSKANIAFASVNDMNGLANHPHLRRITVDSPGGSINYPAPGARFIGEERSYGPVPPLNTRKQ